jgi:Ca-activated chloride channel homolog
MTFARPGYLILLGLIPILGIGLVWAVYRRRAVIARLGDPNLIKNLSSALSSRERWIAMTLWLLAIVFLITASASPQWGKLREIKTSQGSEIIIILDVSASMLAQDVAPDRLSYSKDMAEKLIDQSQGDIGLVIFSGAAFVQIPLTTDKQTAQFLLEYTGTDAITLPGSSLEEALLIAINSFTENRAVDQVILLLSDGEIHKGDPLVAAIAAEEKGITIHTVGIGTTKGASIPIRDYSGSIVAYKSDAQGKIVTSRLNESLMQEIARESGGLYLRATDISAQDNNILHTILEDQVSGNQGKYDQLPVERSTWFSVTALVLLSAETILIRRRRYA